MANLREFVENALQNSIERWKKNNEKKSLVRLVICVCVCVVQHASFTNHKTGHVEQYGRMDNVR